MNEMKEMIYQRNSKKEVLYQDVYRGRKFVILNVGTHPCAYVDLAGLVNDDRLDKIRVHGGFTCFGRAHWDDTDKTIYIGWDYDRCGDFCGWHAGDEYFEKVNKKWTTREIYEEVIDVIDQLIELEAE